MLPFPMRSAPIPLHSFPAAPASLMVPFRVLSRTNFTPFLSGLAYPSRHSSLNSWPFNLLQPLCRRQKSQLLWNQANPASFCKTPGVGVSPLDARPLDFPTFRRSDDKSSLLSITSLQPLHFLA